jgi:hypothetical protein
MGTIAEDYNNPGNLRPPKGVTYDGQIGIGDRGFAIFETPEAGRTALINDIQHKIGSGLNTPDSFLDKYAPEGDNSQEARDNYKIHLMKALNLKSSDEPFPKDSHEKLADAIAHFESGMPNVDTKSTTEGTESSSNTPSDTVKSSDGTIQSSPSQKVSPLVGGAIGASVGATTGSVASVLKAKYDLAKKGLQMAGVINKPELPTTTPQLNIAEPIQGAEFTGETPGGKWGAKTGYGVGEGTVEEASSAYKRKAGQGKVSSRLSKMYGVRKPGESADLFQRMIDRKNAKEAADLIAEAQKAEEAAQIAEAARIAEASKSSSPFYEYAKKLASYPVRGLVSGLSLGAGGVDAYNKFKEGHLDEAISSGLGGIAGAITSPLALPVVGASQLYNVAGERSRYLKQHPEEFKLETNPYDPMGNLQ